MGVKIQRRVVAGLRKCSREFVRRLPDTQLGHRKPQLLKLESNLDRPLVAQSVSKRVNKSLPPTRISANQIMIGEMAAGIAQETTKRPPQAFIASISAAVPVIFITRFRL